MIYNLIFKREAIFTTGMTALWLVSSFLLELYIGDFTTGIFWYAPVEVFLLNVFIGLSSFYFNHILRSTKLVGNNDYSVMFLSAVLLSGLGYSSVSFQFVIGFFLLLALISKIQQGFNQTENIVAEFEMGVIVGLLMLINPLLIVALPFTIVALVNVKVNKWRGFTALVLGSLFVIALKWCWLFFMDYESLLGSLVLLDFRPKHFLIDGLKTQLACGVLGLVFLATINYFIRVSAQLNIKFRVFYKVWLWLSLFLLSGMLLFANELTWLQLLLYINLPLMVLFKVFLNTFSKKAVKELLILLLLVAAIVSRL